MPAVLRLLTLLLAAGAHVLGDQLIYDDSRRNGWEDWGWAGLDYASRAPVHSGDRAIRVAAGPWEAVYLRHAAFPTDPYHAFSFWIHGGETGGQSLVVRAIVGGSEQPGVPVPAPAPGVWSEVTIPLAQLGADAIGNLEGLWIQNATGSAAPTFHLDDLRLLARQAPDEVRLDIDAGRTVGTIDRRHFGLNLAIWDSRLGLPVSRELLAEMGARTLRYPGGSMSDDYDWSTNRQISTGGPFQWASGSRVFAELARTLDAETYLTVNYGSGTPEMAAAWVAWANGDPASEQVIGRDSRGRDWLTVGHWAGLRAASPGVGDGFDHLRAGHPEPYGFRYWEVGNENYGSWEFDLHGEAGSGLEGKRHDAPTYARAFARFRSAMRAVDPDIRVGAVVIAGRDSYPGGYDVPTPGDNGERHDGWTPGVLSTLAGLGVVPDFAIHHFYAQNPGEESDAALLASSPRIAGDAEDLRHQLVDYLGPAGEDVELALTELNSVSFDPGKQTGNLANALFRADSLAVLAATDFRSCLWWDFRNGAETGNNHDPALYGWREFGDYGVVTSEGGTDRKLPAFHASAMLARWAVHGDSILPATSDYPGLSCHAVRRSSGELALLVVNRSPDDELAARISLTDFRPVPDATLLRYGIPEDLADGPPVERSISGADASFVHQFPPYSISVIELRPGLTCNRWRAERFTPDELAAPSISGELADYDRDGWNTLLEYAFGLDPKVADGGGALDLTVGPAGRATFRFPMPADILDLDYAVEVSDDLHAWNDDPTLVERIDDGLGPFATMRLLAPPATSGARFLRLRVTRQPD